jgi:hypothetical protein
MGEGKQKKETNCSSAVLLLVSVLLIPFSYLVCASPAVAQTDEDDPYDPPVVGRPRYFNGAVGSYKVTMAADPAAVQTGDPLLLLVRIHGTAPSPDHVPQRPDLRRFPHFDQFKIEDVKERDRYLPGAKGFFQFRGQVGAVFAFSSWGPLAVMPALYLEPDEPAWEFYYRLRPHETSVKEVPSWPFVYYRPGTLNPSMGNFQTTYVRKVPLRVTPRAQVQPSDVQGAVESRVPDRVLQLVEGPAVLQRDDVLTLPGPWTLVLWALAALLAPPLVCLAVYRVWRHYYPDAARLARLRRSRAADHALMALRTAGKSGAGDGTGRTAGVLSHYLRERLDLPAAEPTPVEVAHHLERSGVSAALAEKIVAFFHTCDISRFAPVAAAGSDDLPAAATQLILALEAELWLSQAS